MTGGADRLAENTAETPSHFALQFSAARAGASAQGSHWRAGGVSVAKRGTVHRQYARGGARGGLADHGRASAGD